MPSESGIINPTQTKHSQTSAHSSCWNSPSATSCKIQPRMLVLGLPMRPRQYTTLAKSMKDSHKESMEQMLKMFKDILGTLPTADKGTAPTPVPAPNAQRPKCPHCNLRHVKPEDCWELEANASKRPANWKPVAERKKRTPEDAGSKRQLSSGNRGTSISGNEIPISLTWLQLALLLHQYYPKTNYIVRDLNRRFHRGRGIASTNSDCLKPTQHFNLS
jgi:hypothetical protein